MDLEEVVMGPEEEEMDSEEAAMVLPEPEAVGMEVVVEALPEAAGMEAAARVKPESEEGAIQGLEGEEGAVILVEEMVVKKKEEGTLRNRPEIRRVVPGVEIMVVVHMVEDSAAAASAKKETEEAKPQKQLLRELQVRAVVEVVDSRVVARSLRAVLEVTRVVAVLEKEVVVVVAMLQQPQPQAIVAAAAAAKEQMEQLETEGVRFQSRLVALL